VDHLLASQAVTLYLDGLLFEALRPWSAELGPEEVAGIRAYAYAELATDPVLRRLVTLLAGALEVR
jgi:hypothetical protein